MISKYWDNSVVKFFRWLLFIPLGIGVMVLLRHIGQYFYENPEMGFLPNQLWTSIWMTFIHFAVGMLLSQVCPGKKIGAGIVIAICIIYVIFTMSLVFSIREEIESFYVWFAITLVQMLAYIIGVALGSYKTRKEIAEMFG